MVRYLCEHGADVDVFDSVRVGPILFFVSWPVYYICLLIVLAYSGDTQQYMLQLQ